MRKSALRFVFLLFPVQLRHIVPAVIFLLAVHSAVGLVEKVVCIRKGVALEDLQNAAAEAAFIDFSLNDVVLCVPGCAFTA